MIVPSPRYHMDTMLGVSKKELFSRILYMKIGYFPEKRNAFVLDDQDGRCDVTCKSEV